VLRSFNSVQVEPLNNSVSSFAGELPPQIIIAVLAAPNPAE
jgi:hypothetical protein